MKKLLKIENIKKDNILFMVIITFVKNFISKLSIMSDDIYINYENNLQLMDENRELKQKLKNDKNLLK